MNRAARHIIQGAAYDNNLLCIGEKEVFVLDSVAGKLMAEMESAGAVRLNYVLNSDIFVVADSGGGGAGLAFEQLQFSRISGAASATGGTGLLIENGYTFSNTIQAIDFEVANTCLAITSAAASHNTFVSPYFNCKKAVKSVAGNANLLLNPLWGRDITMPSFQWTGVMVADPAEAGMSLLSMKPLTARSRPRRAASAASHPQEPASPPDGPSRPPARPAAVP